MCGVSQGLDAGRGKGGIFERSEEDDEYVLDGGDYWGGAVVGAFVVALVWVGEAPD